MSEDEKQALANVLAFNKGDESDELSINYQSAHESVLWLLSYFDYHQELKAQDAYAEEPLITQENFQAFCSNNHLALSPIKRIETDIDSVQNYLPLLAFSRNHDAHVVLEKTPGHWRVYDIKQRQEKYLSNEELQALDLAHEFYVEFDDSGHKDNIEESTSFWDSWIFTEVLKHKKIYRDTLLASVVINMVALFIPLYTMNVYDKVVPNLAFNTLWVLSAIVIIGLTFDWVLKQARSLLTDKIGQEIDTVLSTKILRRIMMAKSEHTPNSIGSFSKSFQDFDGVRDFLNSMTITALVDLPFTLFFLFIIYLVGGPIVIAPMTVMALMLGMTLAAQPKVKANIQTMSQHKSQRSALSFEALQTLDTLKLNNAKQWMLNRWQAKVDECAEASYQASKLQSKLSHTSQMLQQWMTIVVVVTGVYMISEGNLTMGALIATMMLSGRATGSILQISTLITRYQHAKEGISSVDELLKMPPERPANEIQIERKNFHGEVRFDDVSFKYPDCDSYALQDINITINPGERVAVLGGIGSGKTTFLKMLQTLYLPEAGRLLFDNLDAKYWDVDLLRHHISSVEQHPKLLKETIFKNITIGNVKNTSDHHLARALEQSGLAGILPKIEGGLEKQLGENNQGISGGQAQSIALARAFIKSSRLLILDEPTSMMDKNTEFHVMKSLQELSPTTTLILSTHNLSLLDIVDRVIILDQGKVKFDGSVDKLRKNKSNAA